MVQFLKNFWQDEEGAVAIEYALLAVLIALAIAVGAGALGTGLNDFFNDIAACFGGGTGGACPVGNLPGPVGQG